MDINSDFLPKIESVEAQVDALRQQNTDMILDVIKADFRKRFPKRTLRVLFGMGGEHLSVDGNFIAPEDREAAPFIRYFELFDELGNNHWGDRGVCAEEILIEPATIKPPNTIKCVISYVGKPKGSIGGMYRMEKELSIPNYVKPVSEWIMDELYLTTEDLQSWGIEVEPLGLADAMPMVTFIKYYHENVYTQ